MSTKCDKEILENIECPVCFEYLSAPIYLCKTGHSICSRCKSMLKNCPTCTADITSIRNYVLESLVSIIRYPCPFGKNGCKEMQPLEDLKKHIPDCAHRSYGCPFCPAGSTWEGHRNDLKLHLNKTHNTVSYRNKSYKPLDSYFPLDHPNEFKYFIYNSSNPIQLFYICQKYEKKNSKDCVFHLVVRYVGDEKYVKNYSYTMSITSTASRTRKMSWTEVCSNVWKPFNEIIAAGTCVSVPLSLINGCASNPIVNIDVKRK